MAITYTPTTNFGAKDSLPTNDPAKVIKGAEFSTEFTAIQTAFGQAAPLASPTFTGTATFNNVTATGTVTLSSVDINGGTIDGTVIGGSTTAAGDFSSLKVTADAAAGSTDQVFIRGATDNNKQLRLGFDTTSDYGLIQAMIEGTDWTGLALNPFGGNVGIGTSSPGGGENTEDNNGNELAPTLDIDGNLLFSSASPYIKPVTKTESGRPLYIQAGDTRQTGYTGGSLYIEAGGQDPSWGGTANGGSVYIDGGQQGSGGTDGNIILGSTRGNVGIGTTSPDGFVDINQPGTSANDGLFIYSGDAPANGGLVLYKSAAALGTIQSLGANGQLSFNTGTSGAEAMRLDDSGNVGVGTASPARTLHVNDVMRLEPRATAPSSPSAGDIFFNSSTNKLQCYDGTAWQDCF